MQMFQRWMKSKKDVEAKDFELPMSTEASKYITNKCVGKNVTDAVEALCCALFLSTKCFRSVLDWISHIKLVPINMTDMISKFKYNVDYSLRSYKPLQLYQFSTDDSVFQLFQKYFLVEQVDPQLQSFLLTRMSLPNLEIGELGDAYIYCRDLKGQPLIKRTMAILEQFQEQVLRYKFRNPMLLIEALTHRSARDPLEIGVCYEKLEVLGDSILDYLCNYTLLHYTLFERYLEKDHKYYQLEEDFLPADAHQAKSLLVKNEVLAKFCVLLGFHRYVLIIDTSNPDQVSKKDVSDYLKYSFRANFHMNQREIEPFECPKLLGDIFESVMGAIFIDSEDGLEDVIQVYQHLVSPFVLFTAQFSKTLYKEHKEEFIWASIANKIRPQFRFSDEPHIVKVDGGEGQSLESLMYRCDIIYNQGDVMCSAYGSNKRQAERNASIAGLLWLEKEFKGYK